MSVIPAPAAARYAAEPPSSLFLSASSEGFFS